MYDVTNEKSFQSMDKLKKFIEKHKEKKEVSFLCLLWKWESQRKFSSISIEKLSILFQAIIISLGNKCDMKDTKQVDFNTANKWAQGEKGW